MATNQWARYVTKPTQGLKLVREGDTWHVTGPGYKPKTEKTKTGEERELPHDEERELGVNDLRAVTRVNYQLVARKREAMGGQSLLPELVDRVMSSLSRKR